MTVRDLKTKCRNLIQNRVSYSEPPERDLTDKEEKEGDKMEREVKLLKLRCKKDEKLLRIQKKMFDAHVRKLNQQIKDLDQFAKERDREVIKKN
jgi:hypothetical protein